jgi:hypothetical protein
MIDAMSSDFNPGGPSGDPRDVGTRSDGGTWDSNDPLRPSANANTSTVSGDVLRAGGSGDDPIRLHPDDAPGLGRVLAWLRQRHGAFAHVHFDPSAEPLDPAQPLDVAAPQERDGMSGGSSVNAPGGNETIGDEPFRETEPLDEPRATLAVEPDPNTMTQEPGEPEHEPIRDPI